MPSRVPVTRPAWDPHAEATRFVGFRALPRTDCTRRVARDPGTPIETLASLVELFADDVLDNPAWRLASVTEASLLERLTPEQAAAAARSQNIDPASLVALARRTARHQGSGVALRWALVERADLPRAALEALVEGWDRAALGTPVQEMALFRLGEPSSTGPTTGGWRHALPILFTGPEFRFELAVQAKGFQRWRFLCGLIRSGALAADSPILHVLVTVPRSDVRERVVESLPPGPQRDRFAELHACVSQSLWRRLEEEDILLRAAVRAWSGVGPLEPGPDRLARTVPSSGHRGEPYAGRSRARLKHLRLDRCIPDDAGEVSLEMRAPTEAEVNEAARRPRQLDCLTLLASSRCPPELLARAERSHCWFDRLCVASSPVATRAQIRRLCGDVHWMVRSAATERCEAAEPPANDRPPATDPTAVTDPPAATDRPEAA
jgi:hypothetical protein